MNQDTVEDCNGMAAEFRDTLEPLDRGDTPASPAPLPPGGCVDKPGPTQRWPLR